MSEKSSKAPTLLTTGRQTRNYAKPDMTSVSNGFAASNQLSQFSNIKAQLNYSVTSTTKKLEAYSVDDIMNENFDVENNVVNPNLAKPESREISQDRSSSSKHQQDIDDDETYSYDDDYLRRELNTSTRRISAQSNASSSSTRQAISHKFNSSISQNLQDDRIGESERKPNIKIATFTNPSPNVSKNKIVNSSQIVQQNYDDQHVKKEYEQLDNGVKKHENTSSQKKVENRNERIVAQFNEQTKGKKLFWSTGTIEIYGDRPSVVSVKTLKKMLHTMIEKKVQHCIAGSCGPLLFLYTPDAQLSDIEYVDFLTEKGLYQEVFFTTDEQSEHGNHEDEE